ncbi:MAG: hypothetical protein E7182_05805 [Erysipelotrichaceae bacterium]|nr:hypothetical protein [Erysipelotrichaceae bacterium]
MTDPIRILSVVLFALTLFLTFLLLHPYEKEEKTTHEIVSGMTLDAVFVALILLMTFVPSLGYIPVTPFVSLTLLHIPSASWRGARRMEEGANARPHLRRFLLYASP